MRHAQGQAHNTMHSAGVGLLHDSCFVMDPGTRLPQMLSVLVINELFGAGAAK